MKHAQFLRSLSDAGVAGHGTGAPKRSPERDGDPPCPNATKDAVREQVDTRWTERLVQRIASGPLAPLFVKYKLPSVICWSYDLPKWRCWLALTGKKRDEQQEHTHLFTLDHMHSCTLGHANSRIQASAPPGETKRMQRSSDFFAESPATGRSHQQPPNHMW